MIASMIAVAVGVAWACLCFVALATVQLMAARIAYHRLAPAPLHGRQNLNSRSEP